MRQIRICSCKHGFTLVELLVVIGIIALLLPSLNKARTQALKIQDVSNIRQMAIAVLNYASNNNGAYRFNKFNDYGPAGDITDTFKLTMINNDASLSSAGPYYVPIKSGMRPTKRTLFTCLNSFSKGGGGTVPHWSRGYAAGKIATLSNPYSILNPIDGMSMAYTDGSARFVPRQELGLVSGAYWWYYDKTAMN